MKLLFENWRQYLLLSETQILVEGRISDTARKYPELAKKREDLDGESLLDVIIAADPSGNQKYLMGAARILQNKIEYNEKQLKYKPWWRKNTAYMPDGDFFAPWGIARNIAELLPRYHNSMPFVRDQDAPFTDINKIKSFNALRAVIVTAERKKIDRENEKAREEQLKQVAKEGTEFVAKTPYHLIVRPLSKEASCHWGMGSKWCIAATKSENYFDKYTSEGKAFFILLAKKKDVDPNFKKIAVVIDNNGEFEEYFSAKNESLLQSEFEDAILQTIIGSPVHHEIDRVDIGGISVESLKHSERIIRKELEPLKGQNGFDFDADDDIHKVIQFFRRAFSQRHIVDLGKAWMRKKLEPFKGQNGFDFDADDDIREVVALFRDTFLQSYIADLEEAGRISVEETPAGTPFGAYEEAAGKRGFNGPERHIDVTLQSPYDTGMDHVYWESRLWIDVESIINSLEGWELVTDEPDEDDVRSAVDDALNAINIYPENLEADWHEVYTFQVTVSSGYGSLEEFESFLNDAEYDDKTFTEDFEENLIEQLEENGVIKNPEKVEAEKEVERQKTRDAEYWPNPEEKKKQLELPLQENRFRIRVRRRR